MANDENLIPAKKGEVRNPNGRGKGTKNRSTVARELLELVTQSRNVLDPDDPNTEFTQEELMMAKMIQCAKEGDVAAFKAVLDSAYGTPKQTVETTTMDVTPPKVRFIDKKE